jgi:hypothetical protein
MPIAVDELRALDDYEEVEQGLYRRIRVLAHVEGCGSTSLTRGCWTYAAGPALLALVESPACQEE